MTQVFFQIKVPMTKPTQPEQYGIHIFTGPADTCLDALRIARETCNAAISAQNAGMPIPRRRPDGWGARGLRHGWKLDWTAATVAAWENERTFWTREFSSSRHNEFLK